MTLILQGTDNSVSSPAVQGGTAGTTTGVYYPASNQLALASNGTLALLVDGSQNISMGSGVTVNAYQGTSPSNGVYMGTVGGSSFFLATQTSANTNLYLSKVSGFTDPAYIRFLNNSVSTGTITSVSNTLNISNVSGIQFPAAQVASADANTLDDYEEGTWTPSIQLASSSASYPSTRTGSYTKIGNCVYFWGNIVFTASAGITIYNITGLPFNTNGYTSWYPGPAMTNFYYVDLGSGGTMLGAYYNNGANSMHLHSCGNNTNQLAPFTTSNTMELRFEGHYTTT